MRVKAQAYHHSAQYDRSSAGRWSPTQAPAAQNGMVWGPKNQPGLLMTFERNPNTSQIYSKNLSHTHITPDLCIIIIHDFWMIYWIHNIIPPLWQRTPGTWWCACVMGLRRGRCRSSSVHFLHCKACGNGDQNHLFLFSQWIGFLGKILTGNHGFYHQNTIKYQGFPVSIFPSSNSMIYIDLAIMRMPEIARMVNICEHHGGLNMTIADEVPVDSQWDSHLDAQSLLALRNIRTISPS